VTDEALCTLLVDALQCGLENTRELLSLHDARFGRTTKANLETAERLEAEAGKIESLLRVLTPAPPVPFFPVVPGAEAAPKGEEGYFLYPVGEEG